jgi:CubicO group peptidase (beta-lactamase class C family)
MKPLVALILVSFLSAESHALSTIFNNEAVDSCTVPGKSWSTLPIESSGWSEDKLSLAHQYSDSIHSAGVMIVQHGKVVEQWGDVDKKITTFSVRKSLLSGLYGVYAGRGQINVNATLEQLGIDDSPDPLTTAERQARVVDLLRARSGVYHPASFEVDFQKKGRPARGSHPPGTFWFYNNWDYNALGTIFEQQAKQTIGDAFAHDIAAPLRMQDFRASDVYYIGGPESIHRAFMFEMTARDMARFGQLYLCHGRWGTRQIIPFDWVQKSSHADEMVRMGKMPLGGYEYLWWIEHDGTLLDGGATLPGMYAAEGAGGHYILVVPSLDMVIAYQFDNEPKQKDTQGVLAATPKGIYDDAFGHLVRLILNAAPPAA